MTGMGCKPVSPARFYYYQQVFMVVNTSDGRREVSNMSTGETKGGKYGAASSPASPTQLLHFKGDARWLTSFWLREQNGTGEKMVQVSPKLR